MTLQRALLVPDYDHSEKQNIAEGTADKLKHCNTPYYKPYHLISSERYSEL